MRSNTLVFGEPGTGKTDFCCQSEEINLILNLEDGIADKNNRLEALIAKRHTLKAFISVHEPLTSVDVHSHTSHIPLADQGTSSPPKSESNDTHHIKCSESEGVFSYSPSQPLNLDKLHTDKCINDIQKYSLSDIRRLDDCILKYCLDSHTFDEIISRHKGWSRDLVFNTI